MSLFINTLKGVIQRLEESYAPLRLASSTDAGIARRLNAKPELRRVAVPSIRHRGVKQVKIDAPIFVESGGEVRNRDVIYYEPEATVTAKRQMTPEG